MKRTLGVTLAAALAALMLYAASARGQENQYVGKYMKDLKGSTIPELVSKDGDWINADKALTLAGLNGQLVYIEFGFLA